VVDKPSEQGVYLYALLFTTGKHTFAVRFLSHFCRAFSIGRAAKSFFAVRFIKGARQRKTHSKKILCRAFFRRTANNFF
jgi:hypothetical protein